MDKSRYQYDILAHIVNHPQISQKKLHEKFNGKYRHSYLFPFLVKNKNPFKPIAFNNELNLMKQDGLILFMVHGIDYEGFDKDLAHHSTTFLSEDDVDKPYFFMPTEKGRAVIEQHKREAFMFWLPWCVTTLIAITNLIIGLWPLLNQP